jgi:hypothetical protein
LVLSLAAVAPLTLASCSGPGPVQVVARTIASTAAAGSARVSITTTLAGNPTSDVTATGIFDFTRHEGELTFSFDLPGDMTRAPQLSRGTTPASRATTTNSGRSEARTETVYYGGFVYTSLASATGIPGPGLPAALSGKKWLSYAQPGSARTAATPGARAFSALASLTGFSPYTLDPADELQALGAVASDTSASGAETIRGVSTTRYRVTIDPDKALSLLPAGTTTKERQSYQEFVDAFGGTSHTVDLWVDGHGRTRRVRVPLQFTIPGAPVSPSGSIQVDYWDFGVPVKVTPPPPDEVVTQQQMTAALGCGSVASPQGVGIQCSSAGAGGTPTTTTVPVVAGAHSTLQLRRLLGQSNGGCQKSSGSNPPAEDPVTLPDTHGQVCYALGPAQLTIHRASASEITEPDGQLAVQFQLSGSDVAAFDGVARANYEQQLAVVMFGEVLAAPQVNATAFHGAGMITGLDAQDAARVVSALNSGS